MQNSLATSSSLIVLLMSLAVASASPAQAAAAQPASGDFVVVDAIPTSVAPMGDMCHIQLTATFRLQGTLNGDFVANFFILHLGPCDQPAQEYFSATGTFVGEVDGAFGSFEFVFVGEIDTEGLAQGELIINRGTDDLDRLSGRLTLTGLAGVAGTYEGQIHFGP